MVKAVDDAGDPVQGERAINEAEAAVVRRVFREFAAGVSPRAIARRLNVDGIPGPSGKLWIDSTLRGHAKRGTGLINNELYIGRLIWNRLRYVKNPATGRRVSRFNPTEAMRAYAEETIRLNRERRASGESDRKELARVEKKIAEIVDAIEDGVPTAARSGSGFGSSKPNRTS